MKLILPILILIAILILIPLDSFADPFWGNLKVNIEKSYRISGPNSDVVVIRAEITNNDDEEIIIYHTYVRLDDLKNREFSTSNYSDLQVKGHDIPERECPWAYSIELNPGISEDGRFCFEVPKENLTFTLHFYEYDLEWCKNPPYGSCQEKTVLLSVDAPPKTSSSSSSEETSSETLDSSAEIMIASGSSVPGCEDTNSCYIPFRFDAGVGSTITWQNMDSDAHTVTSGTPSRGPNGIFDSSMISAGDFFSHKFEKDDVINYFCMVHPWMTGKINITRSGVVFGSDNGESGSVTVSKDTTPPKMLKPKDIEIDAENQNGAKVTFEVLTIDDTDKIVETACKPSSGSLFSIGTTIVFCTARDSAGNRSTPVSFTVIVNSPETEIPSWVKNVATFWCNDSINDGSFVEAIQYLIDNSIIVVPATQESFGDSQEIPQWVKNNACWWSDGSISDLDFALGLEYLVSQGIIRV